MWSHHWMLQSRVNYGKHVTQNRLGESGEESVGGIDFREPISPFVDAYCSRWWELHNIIGMFQSDIQTIPNWFRPGDINYVKHSHGLHSIWNCYPDPAQRQTRIANQVERLRDFQRDWNHNLEDFEGVLEDISKMYCDKNWKPNIAVNHMANFLQVANTPVIVYTYEIQARWRAVAWFQQDDNYLYENFYSGQWRWVNCRIQPLATKNGKFNRIQEINDCATDSDVKPDTQKPQPQQSHQNKSSSDILLNKAATHATSNISYGRQLRCWTLITESWRMITCSFPHPEFCQSWVNLEYQKDITYTADHTNSKHSGT